MHALIVCRDRKLCKLQETCLFFQLFIYIQMTWAKMGKKMEKGEGTGKVHITKLPAFQFLAAHDWCFRLELVSPAWHK